MKLLGLTIAVCAALAIAGCGGSDQASTGSSATESTAAGTAAAETTASSTKGIEPPKVEVPPGPPPTKLVVTDLKKGSGPAAKPGDYLTVWYVGVYWNGKPLQSSWENGEFAPFNFTLHNKVPEVIPGWERGLPGMKVGGRRELIVPPKLVYRHLHAYHRRLLPSETLVYVVELLKIQ